VLLILVFFTSAPLQATEKYWGAHEAELIFVGTLHSMPSYPWFDGWHMGGTLEIHNFPRSMKNAAISAETKNSATAHPWKTISREAWS